MNINFNKELIYKFLKFLGLFLLGPISFYYLSVSVPLKTLFLELKGNNQNGKR